MATMPDLPEVPGSTKPALPRLAAELFGRPLMCLPDKVDMIIAGLGKRLMGAELLQAPAHEAFTTQRGVASDAGYRVVDGIGVIDVMGVLAHHGGFSADSSYVLGYDTIARRLDAALVDTAVEAIVLNLDSPGGAAAGAFDAADLVRAAARIKPVHAAIGDMAASAAYAIASAASSISITRTGMAGSIGVVMRHVDASAMMKQDGLSVTHIYAGAHKVDGHPFAPLSDAVRADLQAEVDGVYKIFVDTVAANRDLSVAAVRGTEARMYTGQDAVSMGLADRVETPDQLIARLSGHNQPEAVMPKEETPPLAAKTFTKNQMDASFEDGVKLGTSEERDRIGAILGCDAAVTHPEAARTMALTTDMSAEDAERVLAAMPEAAPAADAVQPLSPLAAAMHNAGTPGVGDGGGDAADKPSEAQAILNDFNSATGVPVGTH